MTKTTNSATAADGGGPGSSGAELLDVKETAKLLSASTRTVYRLSDAGKMPRPIKLGALCRWNRGELLTWISQGCPPVRNVRGGAR
jgi:excisionase family DNA binding protein